LSLVHNSSSVVRSMPPQTRAVDEVQAGELHPCRPVLPAVDDVIIHQFAHPLPLPPNAQAQQPGRLAAASASGMLRNMLPNGAAPKPSRQLIPDARNSSTVAVSRPLPAVLSP